MTLLLRVDVTPLNGQVEMSDPTANEYPQWQTGEEPAVGLPQSIAVATQSDADGKVAVEVWTGDLEGKGVNLRPVYEGEFLLTDDHVLVGNTVVNELHPVPLAPGRHRVKVFTSGAESAPNTVYFLVED